MNDDDNDDDTLASIMKKRRAESRLMHWGAQPCDRGGWRVVRGDFELCGPSKRPLRFRTYAGAANRAMKLNREQKRKQVTT